MEIISSLLIWLGCLIIVGGWWSWIRRVLTKRSSSLIPFLGAFSLVIGVYLHPDRVFWETFTPWVFLAFFVDLGSLPLVFIKLAERKAK